MSIAIDFSTLDHLRMTAGHYRYVVQLVRGLSEIAGEQAFVLFGSEEEPVAELRDVFRQNRNWRYRRLPHWQHRGAHLVDELHYLRAFTGEGISLLHVVHDFIPRVARCPIVVTKHDLIEERFPEYEAKRRSLPYRLHRARVQGRVDRIICISETTAADLKRFWGVGDERSVVVHHGVEEAFFEKAGDDLLRNDPVFQTTGPLLASLYNLEPRKNVSTLLKAVRLLRDDFPQLRLVLFGSGLLTPEREARFEAELDQLDLRQTVVRPGVISDAMLKQVYRHADLFVFPSLYEGFGLPVLEALACEACVYIGAGSATAEVAGQAAAIGDTSDPAAFAAGMAALLRDPARQGALRRAGRERAREFPVEKMVRRTWETYQEILKAAPGAARQEALAAH